MKEKLKISKKSYETAFTFHLSGTPASLLVPTPLPPLIPPLAPFPSSPGTDWSSPGDSPFPPGHFPPVGPYEGYKQWGKVIHRRTRQYVWRGENYNYDLTYDEDGMTRYNTFKSNHQAGGGAVVTAGFPTDWGVEDTILGYYPVDSMPGGLISKSKMIVAWNVYFWFQEVNYGPDGLTEAQLSNPDFGAGAAQWFPFIARNEAWQVFFSDDPADFFMA
jgi:hypothetical protein